MPLRRSEIPPRRGDRPAWALALGALAVAWIACTPAEPAGPGTGAPGTTVFSREVFAPRVGDAGASDPPVPASADPAALAEILAAAPRPSPRSPTADGGTAVGADSGVREDPPTPDAPAPAESARAGKVQVGRPFVAAELSDQAIEQALRAEVYWSLTQRCRDPEQRILPPEAVRVSFQIDREGYLVPPTILASAKDERFAEAARCMARVLSTTPFRAPPAARGRAHAIGADVPSVD